MFHVVKIKAQKNKESQTFSLRVISSEEEEKSLMNQFTKRIDKTKTIQISVKFEYPFCFYVEIDFDSNENSHFLFEKSF